MWGRTTLKTGKLARRRRRAAVLKLSGAVFLALTLGVGLVYALNRPAVIISDITVTGTSALNADELRAFVADRISGKYLWLVPRASIFFYPKRATSHALLDKFKRIKTAMIRMRGWRGIEVLIEERTPEALWCGENRLDNAIPNCYFLDEDSFVYAPAPPLTGHTYVRFYGPIDSGGPIGRYFLDSARFRSFMLFITSLANNDIEAVALAVRDEHDYELYLAEGTRILFSNEQELGNVLSNIDSVMHSDDVASYAPGAIDYIDLRFGNKAYYRLRNEGPSVPAVREEAASSSEPAANSAAGETGTVQ